jgi:hypothetical protein
MPEILLGESRHARPLGKKPELAVECSLHDA